MTDENMIDAAAAEAAAAKSAKDAVHAANGTKSGENTSLAFGYDPAAAETLFGKPGEDGRPANIPAKYWDSDGRKVKADVLFNQLRWAEGKLGAKLDVIGGPGDEGYKINLPAPKEGEEPFYIAEDDPAINGFLAVAKKHDVSQKFVDEVLAEVAGRADELRTNTLNAEIAKLGKDGPERLMNMQRFLGAHLTKEQVGTLASLMTSAEAFTAFEALVRATGAPNFVPRDPDNRPANTDGRMTVAQWNALNFEMVDRGGQMVRRRSVDPEFNAMVEAKRDEVFGATRRDASGRPVTETGQRI
jgi:hypothetical protein